MQYLKYIMILLLYVWTIYSSVLDFNRCAAFIA